VARLDAEARVRRGGAWGPLRAGDPIRAGDELELRRGAGVFALEGGGRVWLSKGSQLSCDASWSLEKGACVLDGARLPTIECEGAEVRAPEGGELHIRRAGSRKLEVDVYAGRVVVLASGGEARLGPGQGVQVRRGRVGEPRSARAATPALVPPGSAVFLEQGRPGLSERYPVLLGELSGAGVRGVAKPGAPQERIVTLGSGRPAGLCEAPRDGRIYLRVVLSAEHPLTVQLATPDNARSWRATVPGRWGATHVDLALAAFEATDGGAPIAPGQVLDLLSVQAGTPGQQVPLTVQDARIYAPQD